MMLGLVCSLLNALHFQSEIDIWCEFVPQALFMLSVFGYLCFAIVYKWCTDWVALAERPPSLISMLIAFFMSPGTIPKDAVLFSGQASVQLFLFGMAVIAVPWMLLAKPLLLRRKHLAVSGYKTLAPQTDGSSRRLMDDTDENASDVSDMNGKFHVEEFDFSEVMASHPNDRAPRTRPRPHLHPHPLALGPRPSPSTPAPTPHPNPDR